jgi:hypothetical protein
MLIFEIFILLWYLVGRWLVFYYFNHDMHVNNFALNPIYNIIACGTCLYLSIVIFTKFWYNVLGRNKIIISIINKNEVINKCKIYYLLITLILFVINSCYLGLMIIDLKYNHGILVILDVILTPLFLLIFGIKLYQIFNNFNKGIL